MKNMKEAFGANLRSLRKSKNLTLEKFSEMIDVTPRQLTRIESGETFLTADTLCKISLTLNIDLKTLFDFKWNDNLMYFNSGKFVKPNVKAIIESNGKDTIVKNIVPLSKKQLSIKEKLHVNQAFTFLVDFSKKHNIEIIVEVFQQKERERIVRITPLGQVEIIVTKCELDEKNNSEINTNYEYVIEKVKEFSSDENKISYIKTSIDALNDDNALDNLKSIIQGIELSK